MYYENKDRPDSLPLNADQKIIQKSELSYLNTENEGEHSMTTLPILQTAEIDLGVTTKVELEVFPPRKAKLTTKQLLLSIVNA